MLREINRQSVFEDEADNKRFIDTFTLSFVLGVNNI